MKKGMLFVVLVALFIIPMVSYAGTLEECESKCIVRCHHWDNDEDFNGCMKVCKSQCKPTSNYNLPTTLKSDLNSSKTYAEASTEKESASSTIVVASASDDKDQPCYVGGKYVGNCSRNKPYYNAFNGECYATLKDCGGSSSCVRCGK